MRLLLVLLGVSVCHWGSVSSTPEGYRPPGKRSDDTTADAVLANLASKVTEFNAKIAALEEKQSKAHTNVAFHAHFANDNIPMGPHAHIIFDTARTNVGGGYDVLTGVFRAPVSGTYMFVVNYMGDINTYVYVYMYVDDKIEDYSISHGDGRTWDHVSESIVVHLNAGQRVYLKNGENVLKKLRGKNWSTFSGFLIQADA